MLRIVYSLLQRDLMVAFRQRSAMVNPLVFFVIAVTLFPLSLGPEFNLLQQAGGALIWVAVLLATMLSLENIFHADYDDGFVEQLCLSPHPLPLLVLAKVSAHWLVSGVPALLLAPLLGALLNLSGEAIGALLLTLLVGTPVLSLIGAVGVALTVAQRRGGALLSMLVLPLYMPVLIFGAGAVDLAQSGLPYAPNLSILAALLVLALTFAPWAAAAALRIALE